MTRIVIQRDEQGLLVGSIESDAKDEIAGWTVSELFAEALLNELENNMGSEFSVESDTVYHEALSMIRGDEGIRTLRNYDIDRGGGEYE